MAQHGALVFVGHRHTSRGPAGSAFSLGCLPSRGLWAPAVVGEPWRGAGRLGTIPTQHLCCCRRSISRSGQKWPPVLWGTWTPGPRSMQRQQNEAAMCYQIQKGEVWYPLVHWCECGKSNSSAFTQRQEPLAPFVSCFVAWNLISNYNKPRKPSSTQDHLNNKAKVQILFDFMIAALPGTQQPHAERFIAPRNPLPRGTAGHMNHLERASPFLLHLATNKRTNPEINCFNSPLLWSLSRLLLSLCALLLAGMR